MGVKFDEMERLRDTLAHLQGSMDDFMVECANELAARMLSKVIKRTPVGKAPSFDGIMHTGEISYARMPTKTTTYTTKTGKQATRVTVGKKKKVARITKSYAYYLKSQRGYKGGTLRRGWTATPAVKNGNNYTVEVVNNTHYASYVEYGHRQTPGRYVPAIGKRLKKGWVKGKFMMTLSAKEVEREAEKIMEAKIRKKLKDLGL